MSVKVQAYHNRTRRTDELGIGPAGKCGNAVRRVELRDIFLNENGTEKWCKLVISVASLNSIKFIIVNMKI